MRWIRRKVVWMISPNLFWLIKIDLDDLGVKIVNSNLD
jgi:hypothetical protein